MSFFTVSFSRFAPSPPKCVLFMANAKLPNRPGFALLLIQREGILKVGLMFVQ